MSLMRSLKPFLCVARVFGYVPCSITPTNVVLSKMGVLYSVLCIAGYTCLITLVLSAKEIDTRNRHLLLQQTQKILLFTCLIVEVIVSVTSNRKFSAVLRQLLRYDTAVGMDSSRTVTLRNWTILSVPIIYLGFLMYLKFNFFKWQATYDVPFFTMIGSMSFGVLKFAATLSALQHRFRHLNQRVMAESTFMAIVQNHGGRYGKLQLQNACWLHESLVVAAEEFNSFYSLQLLMWLIMLPFGIIFILYVFIVEVEQLGLAQILIAPSLPIYFVGHLLMIICLCHMTSKEANKMRTIVFSPSSAMLRKYTSIKDDLAIGQYFQSRQLHFLAAGDLMRLDLPILSSIVGSITTYLVILCGDGKK